MTVRRFQTGPAASLDGVQDGLGRFIVAAEEPCWHDTQADVEAAHGRLWWIDPARPQFATTTLLAVSSPDVLGDMGELVMLLEYVSRTHQHAYDGAALIALCKMTGPFLDRQFPWLPEAMARRPTADGAGREEALAGWLTDVERAHPGPHHVEPMTVRDIYQRSMSMRMAAAKPFDPHGSIR